MTFDPTSVEVLCVTLPKDHCVQVPWKYIKVCGYSDLFCKKNLNQRSLTPRWPLTPHLLRSHVWLYPRIILSKSHENTSKYVDTVNLFAKTWTKGHWPLDDLWPHICWGHMCDCAQGSLCPSPMGIRQCMWIQLSILQKLPHTYIHILRTYYVHTTYYVQNQWSHSLFLNYVQARQNRFWKWKNKKIDGSPFSSSKKLWPPLSAHQKSHDPPPYSTAPPPPVEIMNGPLWLYTLLSKFQRLIFKSKETCQNDKTILRFKIISPSKRFISNKSCRLKSKSTIDLESS